MAARLNLHLVLDSAKVVECTKALRARLPPAEWRLVAELAAEVVALWESEHQGQRVVVVPAVEKGSEVAKALRAAGRSAEVLAD